MKNYNWVTAVRFTSGKIAYYADNSADLRLDTPISEFPGDVLEVYVGSYAYAGETRRPQVVLANQVPVAGSAKETFELVFRGPREMAIEIFEAHVGMLT